MAVILNGIFPVKFDPLPPSPNSDIPRNFEDQLDVDELNSLLTETEIILFESINPKPPNNTITLTHPPPKKPDK